MGPPPNAELNLPSLLPQGPATLKKNRCLNAQEYRNGTTMPVMFDRTTYVQNDQGEGQLMSSSDGISSDEGLERKMRIERHLMKNRRQSEHHQTPPRKYHTSVEAGKNAFISDPVSEHYMTNTH